MSTPPITPCKRTSAEAFGPEVDEIESEFHTPKKVNQVAGKSPTFSSPECTRTLAPRCPPLKGKRHPSLPTGPIFSGKIKSTEKALSEKIKIHNELEGTIHSKQYTNPITNKTHFVCKQRGRDDCGAAASLMILSDILDQNESLGQTYWEWFSQASLENTDAVRGSMDPSLLMKNLKTEHCKIPNEKPLTFIKQKIEQSGHSMITAITHKTLEGHWIVVDSVSDTHTCIRDPYTGNAFSVPNDEIEVNYQQDVQENAIAIVAKSK